LAVEPEAMLIRLVAEGIPGIGLYLPGPPTVQVPGNGSRPRTCLGQPVRRVRIGSRSACRKRQRAKDTQRKVRAVLDGLVHLDLRLTAERGPRAHCLIAAVARTQTVVPVGVDVRLAGDIDRARGFTQRVMPRGLAEADIAARMRCERS